MLQTIVKNHFKDYFLKVNPIVKHPDKSIFVCPFCHTLNAQLIDNTIVCLNSGCNGVKDVFQYVRLTKPNFKEKSDEIIADYITSILDLKIERNIDDLLKKYYDAGFFLFPLSPNSKIPIKDCKWKEESQHNIEIWKGWLDRGYGLALNLGRQSNVIAIDIDSMETYDKVKELMGDTLRQKAKRGAGHFLYNYNKDFDQVNHDNLRDKGFEMEVRANNAYIAIAPTSAEGEIRSWNDKKIIDMPLELKKFLMDNINKESSNKDEDQKIQEAINKNDLGKSKLHGLEGNCNDTFIKLGGALRKKLNIDNTEYALALFNNLLAQPMPNKDIKAMMRQLNSYQTYDKAEMAKTVLDRLEVIKEGTAFTLSKTLSLAQKDVEDVLAYLEKEEKVICIGKNRYKRLQQIEWGDNLTDESQPINFEMPYFGKFAYINWREILIIGAISGSGKTVICGNIVKKLNEQKIIPYILSTESTSTLGKTFHKLGVQPGQYKYKVLNNVLEADLPSNAVILLDWLSVNDGEFAKIASIYKHLYDQVKRRNSVLIVFEQLKQNGTFFAENLNKFYSTVAATYHYGNNGNDYTNTFFKTHKIRDSKNHLSFITIPTIYNSETRELRLKDL